MNQSLISTKYLHKVTFAAGLASKDPIERMRHFGGHGRVREVSGGREPYQNMVWRAC